MVIFSGTANRGKKDKSYIKFGLDNSDFVLLDSEFVENGKEYDVIIRPKQQNKTFNEEINSSVGGFMKKGGWGVLLALGVTILTSVIQNLEQKTDSKI